MASSFHTLRDAVAFDVTFQVFRVSRHRRVAKSIRFLHRRWTFTLVVIVAWASATPGEFRVGEGIVSRCDVAGFHPVRDVQPFVTRKVVIVPKLFNERYCL